MKVLLRNPNTVSTASTTSTNTENSTTRMTGSLHLMVTTKAMQFNKSARSWGTIQAIKNSVSLTNKK